MAGMRHPLGTTTVIKGKGEKERRILAFFEFGIQLKKLRRRISRG